MDKKYVIAIIDDDADDSDLLGAAFTDNHDNVSVLSFVSGNTFIEFMNTASAKPSFIITDLYMPLTDGLEIIQAVKAYPGWSDIPIAIISTTKNDIFAATATQLGTSHYFIKPATLIEFGVIADQIMASIS